MAHGQRVLVVDGLSETEEVLKAVLEPRGLEVDRLHRGRGDLRASASAPPSVIVLHEGDTPGLDGDPLSPWHDVPRVVIGSAELADAPRTAETGGRRYLRKPFQYRELIEAIDRLLEPAKPQAAEGESMTN